MAIYLGTQKVKVIASSEESMAVKLGNDIISMTVVGALPPYKYLDYIQSTGTQWIRTDVLLASEDSFNITFEPEITTSLQAICGTRNDSNSSANIMIYYRAGTNDYRLDCNGKTNKVFSKSFTGKVTITYDKTGTTINGTKYTRTASTNSTATIPFGFFADSYGAAGGYFAKGKCYACQLFKNNELIWDGVPAINPKGEIGFLDKVSNTFYKNSGSGKFIAGPEKEE